MTSSQRGRDRSGRGTRGRGPAAVDDVLAATDRDDLVGAGARADHVVVDASVQAVVAARRPEADILADARLCSQPLFHLFVGGETSPALEVRVRAGIDHDLIRAEATGSWGTHAGSWDHVPTADAVLVAFKVWMSEVAERRQEMRRRHSR